MLHSGSRNFGLKICKYFDEVAEVEMKKWYSKSTIPFIPVNSNEGKEYLGWLEFSSRFALLNRRIMMDDVIANMLHYFSGMKITTSDILSIPEVKEQGVVSIENELINIHHNYAAIENHMGEDLWVHRKGATLARKGVIGIVPGSMETKSFITIGLGEKLSLNSCSHGSGRKCGRKDFNVKNQCRVEEIRNRLTAKGIIFSEFSKGKRGKDEGLFDLSETGEAYKDVISIMSNEEDLVKPIVELTPIISLKG